jgi:hypothetical protein
MRPALNMISCIASYAPALNGSVFAQECILANQAQDVHRHMPLQTKSLVSKLAFGQNAQVHIGLELRSELSCVAWSLYESMMSCIVNLCGHGVVVNLQFVVGQQGHCR